MKDGLTITHPARLFRIQDADGRGPYKPGFSKQWVDMEKDDRLCPPMFAEFPDWRKHFDRAAARGFVHFGCCMRGIQGFHRWFTPAEIERLSGFGYRLVDASGLTVVCEGKAQVIGASRWPLKMLPVLEWEAVE